MVSANTPKDTDFSPIDIFIFWNQKIENFPEFLGKGLDVTKFVETEKISSYLYGFIAGDYKTITDNDFKFPISLHSRESKYKLIERD